MIAIVICLFILCVVSIFLSVVALALVCVSKHPQAMQLVESQSPKEFDEEESIPMFTENPNKRQKKNEPFTPFVNEEIKDEEPFFDETDVNNTSHDLG